MCIHSLHCTSCCWQTGQKSPGGIGVLHRGHRISFILAISGIAALVYQTRRNMGNVMEGRKGDVAARLRPGIFPDVPSGAAEHISAGTDPMLTAKREDTRW